LNFLVGRKLYELAYYTWLQFLEPSALANVGLLANGGFELPLSGLPFDWAIAPGTGTTIDVVTRPDKTDDEALLLELGPGRVVSRGVSQTLMLPSGNYRFTARAMGEINGVRGLQWHVTCLGQRKPIADGPMFMGAATEWSELEFSFTVPETDCRAQQLRLDLAARSASEQLVSGSVWYDDVRIMRVDATADGASPATP
jgi:hypothetical protein